MAGHDHGMPDMNNTTMNSSMDGNHTQLSMTHMTFFWGKDTEILFSGWPGSRTGLYVLALIIIFAFSVLVEWLSHSPLFTKRGPKDFVAGLIQTIVHTIQVGIAYLIMLALMSFNGGVFIVAVLGHMVGFLVFGSRVFNKKEVALR